MQSGRRMKLTWMALSLAALACACSGAESVDTAGDELSASHADQATKDLIARFWDTGSHEFHDAYPSDGKAAGYWIAAEAFDAVLDGVQRTHGAKFEKQIAAVYDAQNARGWLRDWFDDENWMALALIRAYDATKDSRYLNRAEYLFADIEQNGRTSSGIWWDRKHTQKATASNFGRAITAARLHERTGKAHYKQAAQEIYDYWYSTMVDRKNARVADHRNADGSVDWTLFTYDTGLAIGASIELFDVTKNHGYLSHAYAFGSTLIHDEVTATPYGDVLYDHACKGDCDEFKGIAYRFLAKLYTLDRSQTQYGKVLHASAQAIWNVARDPKHGTFGTYWNAAPSSSTSLGADASAVMALNLAAEFNL